MESGSVRRVESMHLHIQILMIEYLLGSIGCGSGLGGGLVPPELAELEGTGRMQSLMASVVAGERSA